MMNEKRHLIYEIAEKLNWQVEVDFDDLELESKAYKAGLLFDQYHTLMWDKEGNASEAEALDSLLAKLQSIVCPELSALKRKLEITESVLEQAQKDFEKQVKEKEIAAFEAAREVKGNRPPFTEIFSDYIYPTYEDYIKEKEKND